METDGDVTGSRAWLVWVLGLVAVISTLALGCERRARPDAGSTSPDSVRREGPSQITWDARFVLNEDGRRRAVIRADRMAQYQKEDSTYSVWSMPGDSGRVHSFVFDETGDSSATITADSVVFFNQDGRYDAYGDVVVQTTEGRRLESEHLTWHQFDRTIRTRRFVHITTPTETVRGNGLVAAEDLKTYQIGQFTAEVEVEEESESE